MIQTIDIKKISPIVTVDKNIRGGIPVFKGTRIPVYFVLEDLSLGWEVKDILKSLPEVKKAQIQFLLASFADNLKHNGKKKNYYTG